MLGRLVGRRAAFNTARAFGAWFQGSALLRCEAEPRGQRVPRPSLGTSGFSSFPNSVWERIDAKLCFARHTGDVSDETIPPGNHGYC
jgi:hypothetical protein